MSDAKNLKRIFKEKFGYIPTNSLSSSSWRQYKKQNIVWIHTPQGGYYKDNLTGKKVTRAYERKRKSEITKATQAYINSQKPLSIGQLKANHNVFKAKNDLKILKDRKGNSLRNVINPEPAYDEQGNKLKGGKLYQQQLQAELNQKDKVAKLEKEAALVSSKNYNKTLRAFGISTHTLDEDYADQEIALGEAAKNQKSLKINQNNPAPLSQTGVNNTQVIEETNKTKAKEKAPAPPTVQALLRSDVFTLDEDGNRLGGMTRAQRRAWDAANQDLMRKRQNELKIADRSYYNRGELLRIGSG